jgi:hypothetical protein
MWHRDPCCAKQGGSRSFCWATPRSYSTAHSTQAGLQTLVTQTGTTYSEVDTYAVNHTPHRYIVSYKGTVTQTTTTQTTETSQAFAKTYTTKGTSSHSLCAYIVETQDLEPSSNIQYHDIFPAHLDHLLHYVPICNPMHGTHGNIQKLPLPTL